MKKQLNSMSGPVEKIFFPRHLKNNKNDFQWEQGVNEIAVSISTPIKMLPHQTPPDFEKCLHIAFFAKYFELGVESSEND